MGSRSAALLLLCVAVGPWMELPLVNAASVCLSAFGDDSIRVQIAPTNVKVQTSPLSALLPQPPSQINAPPAPICVLNMQDTVFTNGNLRVQYQGGRMKALRVSDGVVLLEETNLVFFPAPRTSDKSFFGATLTFAGHAGERIYGLGEHRNNRVEQMGFKHSFQDSQLYSTSHGADIMIPYYGSSHGYGFLWATPAYGNVSLTEAALAWTAFAVPSLDLWITTLPAQPDPTLSPLAVFLNRYVDAVGHAAPLPFYASGFWQCKNRYRSQDQLLAVAREHVGRGLPISIIVVDYYHWRNMGDWSFNPECWPDVPGMVAELQSLGIELAVTFWAHLMPAGSHFDAFDRSGFLLRNITTNLSAPIEYWGAGNPLFLTDETNAAAQAAIFEAFWTGYGQYGIRTLWLDGSEPERQTNSFGQFALHAGSDMEIGEAWVREHTAAIARGMASKGYGPGDFVTLARSAWAGSPAHSAAAWSGDIASTFEELATQIKVAQAFALSGQALWTTDIGGYCCGDPATPYFQELIVRWFQFGAFCPLFRLHGQRNGGPPADRCGATNGDNEIWTLAPDPTHYRSIEQVMQLREDLREYVMRINGETVKTGLPMVRAMVLEFPTDPNPAVAAAEDQFMFGPDWLVAPVTVYGGTSHSVVLPTLPSGQVWMYWWNQSRYFAGGQTVTLATPISEFPLFLRTTLAPARPLIALFSASRAEQVLCLTLECLGDQQPLGNYVEQRSEGMGLTSAVDLLVNGETAPMAALWLHWSDVHNDNIVTTNASAPDATYKFTLSTGFVFATPLPGTLPLQLWFKRNSGSTWDYASVASAAGVAWAQREGYQLVSGAVGHVLPALAQ
eukprot:m.21681 g.21681  ORF g.21681 m.21681 type:complete len:843 (+) comp8126_c0_seq1:167-2695(+)